MNPFEALGKAVGGLLNGVGILLAGLAKGLGKAAHQGGDLLVKLAHMASNEENLAWVEEQINLYVKQLDHAELALAQNSKALRQIGLTKERETKLIEEKKRLIKQAAKAKVYLEKLRSKRELIKLALGILDPDNDGKLG